MGDLTNINLIILLKIFKDRPHHLSRFLMENEAFNKSFLDKLNKNGKLSEIKNIEEIKKDFDNIDDMKEFYSSLISTSSPKRKSNDDIISNIIDKIQTAIDNEDYEEAARLRDYLNKMNQKKNNKQL